MRCRLFSFATACAVFLILLLSNSAIASKLPSKYRRPSAEHHKKAVQEEKLLPADEKEEKTALEKEQRYSQKYQSEFGIYGGDFLGDEWYNTWNVGARYYFHISDMFAVGAEYFYSPIRVDSSGDFGKSLRTQQTHSLFAAMAFSNSGTLDMGGIIDVDLYLTIGGGSMQINKIWEPMAVIGGGLKIYSPIPWFSVRFDVNSYLHPTPKPGGDSFNSDIAINAGVSFAFPVRDAKKEDVKEKPESEEQKTKESDA